MCVCYICDSIQWQINSSWQVWFSIHAKQNSPINELGLHMSLFKEWESFYVQSGVTTIELETTIFHYTSNDVYFIDHISIIFAWWLKIVRSIEFWYNAVVLCVDRTCGWRQPWGPRETTWWSWWPRISTHRCHGSTVVSAATRQTGDLRPTDTMTESSCK